MHVVIDSSQFRGRIVDVIVVNKDFLGKNPDVVQDVVGSYLVTAYEHRQKMSQLPLEQQIAAIADHAVSTFMGGNTPEQAID